MMAGNTIYYTCSENITVDANLLMAIIVRDARAWVNSYKEARLLSANYISFIRLQITSHVNLDATYGHWQLS